MINLTEDQRGTLVGNQRIMSHAPQAAPLSVARSRAPQKPKKNEISAIDGISHIPPGATDSQIQRKLDSALRKQVEKDFDNRALLHDARSRSSRQEGGEQSMIQYKNEKIDNFRNSRHSRHSFRQTNKENSYMQDRKSNKLLCQSQIVSNPLKHFQKGPKREITGQPRDTTSKPREKKILEKSGDRTPRIVSSSSLGRESQRSVSQVSLRSQR